MYPRMFKRFDHWIQDKVLLEINNNVHIKTFRSTTTMEGTITPVAVAVAVPIDEYDSNHIHHNNDLEEQTVGLLTATTDDDNKTNIDRTTLTSSSTTTRTTPTTSTTTTTTTNETTPTKYPLYPFISNIQIIAEIILSIPLSLYILITIVHQIGTSPPLIFTLSCDHNSSTSTSSTIMYGVYYYLIVYSIVLLISLLVKVIIEYNVILSTWNSLKRIRIFSSLMTFLACIIFPILLTIYALTTDCFSHNSNTSTTNGNPYDDESGDSQSLALLYIVFMTLIILFAEIVIISGLIRRYLPQLDFVLNFNTQQFHSRVKVKVRGQSTVGIPIPSEDFPVQTASPDADNNMVNQIEVSLDGIELLSQTFNNISTNGIDYGYSRRDSTYSISNRFLLSTIRVKNVALHPTQPSILVALYSGVIELWDYEQQQRKLMEFHGHDGPVRGLDFHSSLPYFISGGDDTTIRLWHYDTPQPRCLFTFLGHNDYVRSIQFHPSATLPLFLSASDDQTIRIWHFEDKECLCVLTGHAHYVMTVSFHPVLPYILSCSLDQSIRYWDYSKLKTMLEKEQETKRLLDSSSSPSATSTSDREILRSETSWSTSTTSNLVMSFVVKQEAHQRGINQVISHPRIESLCVSSGDDQKINIWSFDPSNTSLIKEGSIHCHRHNVSSAIFHSIESDLILSISEDGYFRIVSMKEERVMYSLRLGEETRGWCIVPHPTKPDLYGIGTDHEMMILNIHRNNTDTKV